MQEPIQLLDLFFRHSAAHPERTALITGAERISFGELEKEVHAAAMDFQRRMDADGAVLMLDKLTKETVVKILALIGIGHPVVFVEEWTRLSDVREAILKSECKYIISSPKLNFLRFFLPGLRNLKSLSYKRKSDARFSFQALSSQGAALISFSSGTSGASKAIVRTRSNLQAQFDALSRMIHVEEDAIMGTNFAVVILLNLGLGIGTFLSKGINLSDLLKSDISIWYKELKENKVTHLAHSPILLRKLAACISNDSKGKLSFKQIISGGSPQFPAHFRAIAKSIDSEEWTLTYGSSEAEPVAHCGLAELLAHEHEEGVFIGRQVEEVDAGLWLDSVFSDKGEIVVSGAHVVDRYLHSETAFSKSKLMLNEKLYHRCGDRAERLTDGVLVLKGPMSLNEDVYISEKQLSEIDGIEFATMLGKIVYVQILPGMDRGRIRQEIMKKFDTVKEIRFIKMPLDRRHRGKILYNRLDQASTI